MPAPSSKHHGCARRRYSGPGSNSVALAAQRFVDWVAGPGLEWFHVEADDQQRAAEEGLDAGSPSVAAARRPVGSDSDLEALNLRDAAVAVDVDKCAVECDGEVDACRHSLGCSSVPIPTPTASPSSKATCVQPLGTTTNRFGKRFVYIPSLRRSIAQRDRASVRSAAFSAFMCLVLLWVLQGSFAWAVLSYTVTCGSNSNATAGGKSATAAPSVTPLTPHYPFQETLFGHSHSFRLLFLVAAVGTNALMMILRRGGRDGSYSDPGFISHEGGEVKWEMTVALPRTRGTVNVSVPEQLRRHCNACGTARPLRSRHCRDCGRCVSRFDHHCNWLGHCVGSRNYAPFLAFALTGTIYGVLGAVVSLGAVVWPSACFVPQSAAEAAAAAVSWSFFGSLRFLELNWVPLMIALGTGGLGFGMGCLVLMHFGLAAADTTTYEFARGSRLEYLTFSHALGTTWEQDFDADIDLLRSPFGDGAFNNFVTVIFRRGLHSLRRVWCGAVPEMGVVRAGSPDGINYFVREPFTEAPSISFDHPGIFVL